jgi:hypothetical protein
VYVYTLKCLRVQSNYTYEVRKIRKHLFLCIEDLNKGGKSVTNNIHNIVLEISRKHPLDQFEYLIIYHDSTGIWDGYDFAKHQFISLNQKGWLQAAIKMLEL